MAASVAGEKFCLRWNDFENNISNSFRELKEDKDFFDVTLACDDNQLQAHKVILSACSSFFRSLLKKNPHPHPLLYLKGVKYEEILSVLNFMYHGEVNVAQEDLNTFLAVAEDLQVKGLTQNNKTQTKTQKPAITRPSKNIYEEQATPNTEPAHREPKQHRVKSSIDVETAQVRKEIQEITPKVKIEAPAVLDCDVEPEVSHEMVDTEHYQDEQDDYGYEQSFQEQSMMYQEEHVEVGQTMNNSSQGWSISKQFSCYECGKSYSNKKALQNHTNSHKGLTYCEICSKHFSTVSNLRAHMNTHHQF